MNDRTRGTDAIGPNHWPTNPLRRLSLSVSGIAFRAAYRAAEFGRDFLLDAGAPINDADPETTFIRWLEKSRWPSRCFRVATIGDERWMRDVRQAGGRLNIEWVELNQTVSSLFDARALCRDHRFDAVVLRSSDGLATFVTLENAGRAATWDDWSHARPAAYLTLFPPSIDSAGGGFPLHEVESRPGFFRSILEAAALFSRSPNRLTLEDRVAGRFPGPQMFPPGDEQSAKFADPRDMIMLAVFRHLADDTAFESNPGAQEIAAARACSAWFATHGPAGTSLNPLFERCACVLGNDGLSLLRMGANQASSGDECAAIATFVRAHHSLHEAGIAPSADQTPFLQADLELGGADPQLLGRIVAGAVLMAGAVDAEKTSFFCDDLMDDLVDDLRSAGWTGENDPEQGLLLRTFAAIRQSVRHRAMRPTVSDFIPKLAEHASGASPTGETRAVSQPAPTSRATRSRKRAATKAESGSQAKSTSGKKSKAAGSGTRTKGTAKPTEARQVKQPKAASPRPLRKAA